MLTQNENQHHCIQSFPLLLIRDHFSSAFSFNPSQKTSPKVKTMECKTWVKHLAQNQKTMVGMLVRVQFSLPFFSIFFYPFVLGSS